MSKKVELSKAYLQTDALFGAAYVCRMMRDNPDLSEDARKAYEWAEGEFVRIAKGEVDERDLIG